MIEPGIFSGNGLTVPVGETITYWIVEPWWITATALFFALAGLLVGYSMGRKASRPGV